MSFLLDVDVPLALAVRRRGALATFDRRIDPGPVHGGRAALAIID